MTRPAVTVILPTHQRPAFLERAVASVVAQTCREWELIVVENGGPRSAPPVLERFPTAGIHYTYIPEANLPAARNRGLALANGRYIAFLDDDDEWLPAKLERQLEEFAARPTLELLACGLLSVEAKGTVTTPSAARPLALTAQLAEGNLIWSPSSVMVTKAAMDAIGGFNPRIRRCADFDLYARLLARAAGWQMAEPLARYYRHAESMSADPVATLRALIDVLRPWLRHDDPAVRAAAREGLRVHALRCYGLAGDRWEQGRDGDTLASLLVATGADPLIGHRVPWSRGRHPIARVARPYVWMAWAGLRSLRHRRAPLPSRIA